MTTAITITLPFPYPELSPNSRCGWQAKAAAVQAYRHECKVEAMNAFREKYAGLANWLPMPPIEATITFVLKDKRRHDWDNLLASFKAGIDGIVDAGLLPDDDVKSWSPTLRYEQGAVAGVRVELTAGGPEATALAVNARRLT